MKIPTTLLLISLLTASPLTTALRADEPAATTVSGTVTLAPESPDQRYRDFQKLIADSDAQSKNAINDVRNLTIYMSPKMVKAAYLGVAVSAADETLQSQLGLPEGVGLIIRNVDPQSPAQSAGLQNNDIITRLADQIIINPNQFEVLVRSHHPGESVEITVIRHAQPVKLSVTLTEKEEPELSWVLNNFNHPFFSPAQGTVNPFPVTVNVKPPPSK